ncbi:MAG: integrase core domain-containing protein [Holosporaceae bacterium]|nr:integrase core domain-containing protein [Holosporaceae bacterium]
MLANNITEMRMELENALWKYNNYRPHANLNGATPMEYIQANCSSGAVSHVSNLHTHLLRLDTNAE